MTFVEEPGTGDEDDFFELDDDEADDAAVDAAKHERTRRSALRWASAAGVLVVVAGVAAALVWKSPARDGAGSTPTLRVDGHTYVQRVVPANAATRDAADPAVVHVLVVALSGNSDPGCNRLRPAARMVSHTATTVTIRTSVYLTTTGSHYCAFEGTGSLYARIAVHLDRSLGPRSLVNDSDGSAVALVEPGAPPTPAQVPAGYVAQGTEPADPVHGMLDSVRRYARGDNELRIDVQPTVETPASAGAPEAIVSVDGARAEVRHTAGTRCIVWVPRPGITESVCSSGPSLLTQDEVLAVARSLH